MKSILVILLGMFAGLSIIVSPVVAEVPGGKSEIAVDDAGVVQAANFAIEAQKKAADDKTLSLVKIISAQRQVVQGFSYTLSLSVKTGDETKEAVAVVWVKPVLKDQKEEDRIQLTSWTWK